MPKMPAITDIPGFPICPRCNSRFEADGDDYRLCPECRRSTELAYGERLEIGFMLLDDDENDL